MEKVFERLQRWETYAAFCGTTVEDAKERVRCAMQASADSLDRTRWPDRRAEHMDFNLELSTVLAQCTPDFLAPLPAFMEKLLGCSEDSLLLTLSPRRLSIVNNEARCALSLYRAEQEGASYIKVQRYAIRRGTVTSTEQLDNRDSSLIAQLHAGDESEVFVSRRYAYYPQGFWTFDAFRDVFVPAMARPRVWDVFCSWWFDSALDVIPCLEYLISQRGNTWTMQFPDCIAFKCSQDVVGDIFSVCVETSDGKGHWTAWHDMARGDDTFTITVRHLQLFLKQLADISSDMFIQET